MALGSSWYLTRAPARYAAIRARVGETTQVVHETSDGIRTLLAYGRSPVQALAARTAADRVYDAVQHATRARNVLRPCVTLGQVVALAGVLGIGIALVGTGSVTIGVVTAAALYLVRLVDPVATVLELLDEVQSATAALGRIVGVADAAAPLPPARARPAGQEVVLHDVTFAYGSGPAVLRGLHLTVRPGEHLVVVGASGAGKSTMGKLVAGADRPDGGRITIGEVDVGDLGQDVNRHVVLLTQETHTMAGPLAEDLSIAAPTADAAALRAALDRVGATAWVAALPAGLDTVVGDGGLRLTPTQAQQVALARLVLLDPPVVVLDEATAALTPQAARRMDTDLHAALDGRTVIAITHRLTAASRADRIAVLDAGRLVELGTHEKLLAARGGYAELWMTWRGARE